MTDDTRNPKEVRPSMDPTEDMDLDWVKTVRVDYSIKPAGEMLDKSKSRERS
jgi:hypothetical protein